MTNETLRLTLQQKLQTRKVLEDERLEELVGSNVIFSLTSVIRHLVTGTLKQVGEHYLFLDDVRLINNFGLEPYLTGEYPVELHVKAEAESGIYGKSDISEMYKFEKST